MTPSDQLTDFLRGWEGPPSLVPRFDAVGNCWDIGYGHVCSKDTEPLADEQAAVDQLVMSIGIRATAVNQLLGVHIDQCKFDALVSFAYNLGVTALAGSTLLRLTKAGQFDAAANEFAKWDHAGGVEVAGLKKRRAAERAIYADCDYSQRP